MLFGSPKSMPSEIEFGDELMSDFPTTLSSCCSGSEMCRSDSEWGRSLKSSTVRWDWDEFGSPMSLRGRSISSASPCVPSTLSLVPGECSKSSTSLTRPSFGFNSPSHPVTYHSQTSALSHRQELPPWRQLSHVLVQPTSFNHSLQAPSSSISPEDVSSGEVDFQGIPWERFSISRDDYRKRRMNEYSNYNNVTWNAQLEHKRRISIDSPYGANARLFSFRNTNRAIAPTIDHFQLRQLLWQPTNSEVYYVSHSVMYRLNRVTGTITKVHAQVPNQMACCHVEGGYAASGAFDSEVVVSSVGSSLRDHPPEDDRAVNAHGTESQRSSPQTKSARTLFRRRISEAENSITNHVCLFNEMGEPKLLVANNDAKLRELDISKEGVVALTAEMPWAINHVSVCGNRGIACLAGDSCDLALFDRKSGTVVDTLSGHLDFSFCSDWAGNYLATGSQDGTCRVWDVRSSKKPVRVLGALLGAARSVRFSQDGNLLAFSEPADFLHVYNAKDDYSECQVIDLFGNIAGFSLSPDASRLSVAVCDSMFGCLMEFRTHPN